MIANLIGILLCVVLAVFLTPKDAWTFDDEDYDFGEDE